MAHRILDELGYVGDYVHDHRDASPGLHLAAHK